MRAVQEDFRANEPPCGAPLLSVAAAQALAAAIRRKHRGRLHNRGVGEEAQLRAILSYLDDTTTKAGLESGLGDGILPEEPVSLCKSTANDPTATLQGTVCTVGHFTCITPTSSDICR